MRLLIAILEERKALEIRLRLYGMDERWDIGVAADGAQAALLLKTERWDALLLDSRLRADGASLWETLCQAPPLCPPRVLALWQDGPRPAADCAVPADSGGARIAALLSVLAKKPLPYLAAAHRARIERAAERFLDALGMRREWKGRSYAAWCLCRRVPVPGLDQQPVNRLYAECAKAFGVSAGAVPSRRRGGRVHHGQYPQHRALLRRDHRPGQGQAHQPGLSDGSRRAASLTH